MNDNTHGKQQDASISTTQQDQQNHQSNASQLVWENDASDAKFHHPTSPSGYCRLLNCVASSKTNAIKNNGVVQIVDWDEQSLILDCFHPYLDVVGADLSIKISLGGEYGAAEEQLAMKNNGFSLDPLVLAACMSNNNCDSPQKEQQKSRNSNSSSNPFMLYDENYTDDHDAMTAKIFCGCTENTKNALELDYNENNSDEIYDYHPRDIDAQNMYATDKNNLIANTKPPLNLDKKEQQPLPPSPQNGFPSITGRSHNAEACLNIYNYPRKEPYKIVRRCFQQDDDSEHGNNNTKRDDKWWLETYYQQPSLGRHEHTIQLSLADCEDFSCARACVRSIRALMSYNSTDSLISSTTSDSGGVGGGQEEKVQQQRYLLVLNPMSGSGKGMQIYNDTVKPMLDQTNKHYDLFVTTHSGHATERCHSMKKRNNDMDKDALDISQYTALIMLGGDGVLFEVMQGIHQRDDSWELLRRLQCSGINIFDL
mmetsp:Transcript_40929/g.47857  ORF Transcript_40929/g.47857 Transcript_40929/m.47857 type:complete len:482 (+) Transcript_40929:21-1466(+)